MFTDLDDTLFQTQKKLPPGLRTAPAALDKKGVPQSFLTSQQSALISLFSSQGASIIPVTGRNQAAFDRHVLNPDLFSGLRILSHGAIVSDCGGRLYEPWRDYLLDNYDLEDWGRKLKSALTKVQSLITSLSLRLRSRVISEHGIVAYVSIKADNYDHAESLLMILKNEIATALPSGFRVHSNGNNLALLAPYASKECAVRFVINELKLSANDLVIGLGDSITDFPFLRETHFGMFPIGSQIDRGFL
ncbi:hypothetical protein [Microbulbifer guangxiensis]|uniref:hypothetical protein n=1 Tax=Microbulbifer guangxiensis TaxID=2904249 RepID=UPI001F2E2712|nr:hypothetical protein [Microbulbifer guangxiensis]